ncbi:MAG TPA: CDP-alcohol phosphatidyltransferase family protein [Aquihabitans sp.]|jgi:phosphatidylglycerophosphate synthase|nr:CDP-alcohol phosphatidyltransferase family protein [Aquihabitans sp.]
MSGGEGAPTIRRGAGGVRARTSEAMAKLGGAQKSAVGVPAYLRYVNRRVGGWLAALGHGLGLTPNHLTAISAACSAVGIAAIGLVDPSIATGVLVALVLLLGYAFDSADGQLSRVRGGGGPSGEWLDHVVDMAKTGSLHAAVAVGLHRFAGFESEAWALVPLAFGVVNVTFFFGMLLRDQLGGRPPRPDRPTSRGPGSPLRSFLLLPMDYGVLCATFVLLGAPRAFLVAYGALLLAMVGFTAQSFVKAYRSLVGTR